MDNFSIDGRVIAVLASDGFEAAQLDEPRRAFEGGGAAVHVITTTTGSSGRILAAGDDDEANAEPADVPVKGVVSPEYDGLWIPGGAESVAALRADDEVRRLVRSFFDERKPIAAVDGGIHVLVDAGITSGLRLSQRPDAAAANPDDGALRVDEDVVVDGVLMTARSAAGLQELIRYFIEAVSMTPLPPARQNLSVEQSTIQGAGISNTTVTSG